MIIKINFYHSLKTVILSSKVVCIFIEFYPINKSLKRRKKTYELVCLLNNVYLNHYRLLDKRHRHYVQMI